jgi:hypothetical protein
MNNPFATFQGFAGQFQQFMGNPAQFLMQNRLNIPQQYMNNPNDAVQYLMNSGKLNQQTYNYLNNIAGQIQNTPMFKQFIGSVK